VTDDVDERHPEREAVTRSPGRIPVEGGGNPGGFAGALSVLRIRNFRLFWSGQLVSGTGTWMQAAAQSWLVLEISHSPLALGTVTMLQFLPILLFVVPAGVFADRVPKRRLLIASQSIAGALALVLGLLVLSGHVAIWQIGVLAFGLGLTNAVNNPAQLSFVAEMVGGPRLGAAVSLNSVQFNLTRLIGPALAGMLIAGAGLGWTFVLNAASFLAAVITLLAMRPEELVAAPAGERTGALSQMREGLSYARRSPAVLSVLIILGAVGLFGFNWLVAVPLLARDVLDLGAAGYGLLMSALGAGALVAAVVLSGTHTASTRRMGLGGGILGLALLGLGLSGSYPLSLVLMVVAGAAGAVFTVTANTRLQLLSPGRLRGRMMSLYVLLMAGTTPIGSYLLGHLANGAGTGVAVVAFGLLTVAGVVTGLIYRRRRSRDPGGDPLTPAELEPLAPG
jgi:MFS family permease